MARDGAILSVIDDVGWLRDVLVQGPVCSAPEKAGWGASGNARDAVRQHEAFVRELERAGVTVRRLDTLLASALGFADARDWIVERRVGEYVDDRRSGSEIVSWMSEQPAETLIRFLMEGTPVSALPTRIVHLDDVASRHDGWFLPPLVNPMQLRAGLRFIEAGAVVCPHPPAASRASAITISTVLNFAPLFDESRFEFWLTSDGADRSCPPIDGHDIAMPGRLVCVGGITHATSLRAFSELAASLFRRNRNYTVFCLDLAGTGCECLDDCFIPLDRETVLVDSAVLGRARAFSVRAHPHGMALAVEPCGSAILDEFARALGGDDLCLIDMKEHTGPVGSALSRLAPIVLSPGRIMVFEQHHAAFHLLEQHGIEIVSVLDGSALSCGGKGPRGLMSALRAG